MPGPAASRDSADWPGLLTLTQSPHERHALRELWLMRFPQARVVAARTVADAALAVASGGIAVAVIDTRLTLPLAALVHQLRRLGPEVSLMAYGAPTSATLAAAAGAPHVHSWRELKALLQNW